jgi:hypothetical protein
MSFGIGQQGTPMSESTCSLKLRSLQSKGCIEIVDVVRDGTRVRLRLPSEIAGVIPRHSPAPVFHLEDLDCFNDAENRLAILRREGKKCFYCLRDIDASNFM